MDYSAIMRKVSFVFLLSLRHDQDKKIFHFVVTFTTACEEKRGFFLISALRSLLATLWSQEKKI